MTFEGREGCFVGAQRVSDNFKVAETVGRLCFENAGKIKRLEMWHYCCFYICINIERLNLNQYFKG